VQTKVGALRAIEAGSGRSSIPARWTTKCTSDGAEGIWRVGPRRPFTPYRAVSRRFDRTVAGMKNAYAARREDGVLDRRRLLHSRDDRGEVVINFLLSWKAFGIPAKDILKIMTINGYEVREHRGRARPDQGRLPGRHDRR
jgi:hypothetical protein